MKKNSFWPRIGQEIFVLFLAGEIIEKYDTFYLKHTILAQQIWASSFDPTMSSILYILLLLYVSKGFCVTFSFNQQHCREHLDQNN